MALPVLSIPPDALWRGTLLMKPGGFLCMSGEAHRAGREGRTRLEIHAQKVEATRDAADEGVLRLPTFQPLPCGGEHPGHGREAVARPAGPEVGEQPGFPRVPVPAEVPHGMVGVAGLAALAQPLESALHQRRPRPRRPAARGGWSGGECGAVGHGWEVVGQAVAKLAVRRARWRVGPTPARMQNAVVISVALQPERIFKGQGLTRHLFGRMQERTRPQWGGPTRPE